MNKIDTVAIIDDDRIYQYMAKKTILAIERVESISTFSDGQEAIDFLRSNINSSEALPGLIFLDINMPIVDGWQFLEKYKTIKTALKKDIKICIVTSSMNPDDLIHAKNNTDVLDYIVKPLTATKIKLFLEKFKLTEKN